MTKNRFTLRYCNGNDFDNIIQDNGSILTINEVVELLNELHEENQELKQLIKKIGELGGFNKHMIKTIYEGLDD
jgi:hypothetical protein